MGHGTGATLGVAAGASVQISAGQTMTDNGALSFASSDTVALDGTSGGFGGGPGPAQIVVDGTLNAIGTNFVTEVVDDGKGALFSKVVRVIPNVNQTLGYDPAVFAKIGLPSRTVPECKKY